MLAHWISYHIVVRKFSPVRLKFKFTWMINLELKTLQRGMKTWKIIYTTCNKRLEGKKNVINLTKKLTNCKIFHVVVSGTWEDNLFWNIKLAKTWLWTWTFLKVEVLKWRWQFSCKNAHHDWKYNYNKALIQTRGKQN